MNKGGNDIVYMKLYDYGFEKWLDNIQPTKLRTALRAGLRKSLNIITKQAKKNLKGVTKNYNRGSNKWGLKLIKGIVTKIYKKSESKYKITGVSEIIGQGKKNSDFRLKFFELGTVDRYIKNKSTKPYAHKKGYKKNVFGKKSTNGFGYRGRMKATPFFSTAVNSKKAEVEQSMEKNFQEALERAFKNYVKK